MAKEKETQEVVREKKGQYHLSDTVLQHGYTAQIPKRTGRIFRIGFNTDLEGKRLDRFASVMESAKNPARGGGEIWKSTGITYLEDLTDEQLYILAKANVIMLDKEQAENFSAKFYSKK
jgi:tRNA(Leu) C34 or U34 (ribose-2'-O)-methylase TrmL